MPPGRAGDAGKSLPLHSPLPLVKKPEKHPDFWRFCALIPAGKESILVSKIDKSLSIVKKL